MADLPLAGRTVVITRSEEKSEGLKAALEALGAGVLVLPAIRHAAAGDEAAIARAIGRRADYSHVIFASQTAVRFFLSASARHGVGAAEWSDKRFAAVGRATALALEDAGLKPSVVTSRGGADLAAALLEREGLSRGRRVLLPGSAMARPELRGALERAGVEVDAVVVYDTLAEDPAKAEPFLRLLRGGAFPDAVTFASPSAVNAFVRLTGGEGAGALRRPGVRVVSIGPTTSEAIRAAGFSVAAEADSPAPREIAAAVRRAIGGP